MAIQFRLVMIIFFLLAKNILKEKPMLPEIRDKIKHIIPLLRKNYEILYLREIEEKMRKNKLQKLSIIVRKKRF